MNIVLSDGKYDSKILPLPLIYSSYASTDRTTEMSLNGSAVE